MAETPDKFTQTSTQSTAKIQEAQHQQDLRRQRLMIENAGGAVTTHMTRNGRPGSESK